MCLLNKGDRVPKAGCGLVLSARLDAMGIRVTC